MLKLKSMVKKNLKKNKETQQLSLQEEQKVL